MPLSRDELVATARAVAAKHALPADLVCAICDHESGGWKPFAVRYEPTFFIKYVAALGGGITMTERFMRATSFGLMQIMGQTARELGFAGDYLTELCDPEIGIEFGCRKLERCLDKHNHDVRAALLAYNGGGNPGYPNLVLSLVANYKTPHPTA